MLADLEIEDSEIKFSTFTFQIKDPIPGDFDMGVDYINIVKNIVLKHVPHDEFAVFLFGSRAVGNDRALSDIDVGIFGKRRSGSLSSIVALLAQVCSFPAYSSKEETLETRKCNGRNLSWF